MEGRAASDRAHVWFVADPEVAPDEIVGRDGAGHIAARAGGRPSGAAEALRLTGEAHMYDGRAADGQAALERAIALLDPDRFPRSWNAVCSRSG